MGRFAYIVAHDLKGPVNGIASQAEYLVQDYADVLGKDGREQVHLIRHMAARVVQMVEALRQFADVSQAEIERVVVHPGELFSTAMQRAAVAETTSVCQGRAAGVLPSVTGDRALLTSMLERLISNALVYNTSACRTVEITHLAEAGREIRRGHAAFGVRDNGIGIPPKHRADVFEMFQRLHGPGRFGDRVGSGLAIARAIVERHGGTIWVESVEGQGSTFCFTLPRPPAASSAIEALE